MKVYSNDAVTTDNINALDEKQTREIEKLKLYVYLLAGSQVATFAMTIGLFLMS